MESQHATETKEEYTLYVSDRRLIGLVPMFILVLIIVLRISWTLYKSFGQKTRSPQQRRMYAGSRARPSLGQPEPSIYVSPSNYPPPPKYECMAPPSYDEVVGVHYPNYPVQPITQPITAALAQNTAAHTSADSNEARGNDTVTRSADVVVTVVRPTATSS